MVTAFAQSEFESEISESIAFLQHAKLMRNAASHNRQVVNLQRMARSRIDAIAFLSPAFQVSQADALRQIAIFKQQKAQQQHGRDVGHRIDQTKAQIILRDHSARGHGGRDIKG